MRRKRARRIRYRPVRRSAGARRRRSYRLIHALLIAVASVSIALIAQAAWRTVNTRRVNAALQAMRTSDGAAPSVEVAAPPMDAGRAERAVQAAADLPEGMALMGNPKAAVRATSRTAAVEKPERTVYHNVRSDILPDMLKLSRINPDLIGWIRIDSLVNLPVVYRDNEYYLTHDFYGHRSKAGTLFLDAGHPLTESAANLLIHGHDMADGTMFGLLVHYQRDGYIEKHPVIRFTTLWEEERYAVFAVLRVPTDPTEDGFVNYYAHPTFPSDAAFEQYIDTLRRRALQTADIDVRPGDALLTLTTCLDDDRLIIVARRMTDDAPSTRRG